MTTVLTVLHVLVCVFLVAVVLLQRGKGAEIGAVFGSGASSTVFGSRGAGNFLTKLTTGSAVVFMLTSLLLSYYATTSDEVLFQDGAEDEAAAPAAEEGSLFENLGEVPLPGATGEAPAAAAGEVVVEEVVVEETATGSAAAAAEEATGVGVEEIDAALGAAEAPAEAPAAEAPPTP